MFKMKYSQLSVLCLVMLLTACTSTNKKNFNNQDPLEPFNRGMYKLNKTLDCLYINPVVKVYTNIFPYKLRKLVTNFFNNIGEIPVMVNRILQAKMPQFIDSAARFTINSTLGVGGLFDVASNSSRLKIQKTDFGVTLYKFGYRESMYLYLPIIGPTTVRDGVGLFANSFVSATRYLKPKWRNRYLASYFIQRKSELSEVNTFIDTMGVDEYLFVKDAYLQNRQYVFNEGSNLQTDLDTTEE